MRDECASSREMAYRNMLSIIYCMHIAHVYNAILSIPFTKFTVFKWVPTTCTCSKCATITNSYIECTAMPPTSSLKDKSQLCRRSSLTVASFLSQTAMCRGVIPNCSAAGA